MGNNNSKKYNENETLETLLEGEKHSFLYITYDYNDFIYSFSPNVVNLLMFYLIEYRDKKHLDSFFNISQELKKAKYTELILYIYKILNCLNIYLYGFDRMSINTDSLKFIYYKDSDQRYNIVTKIIENLIKISPNNSLSRQMELLKDSLKQYKK